jgi:hypothetical protein
VRSDRHDRFVEAQCTGFYADTMGRPGLPPGIYFRLLLIGYFEGIDSERRIASRDEISRFAANERLDILNQLFSQIFQRFAARPCHMGRHDQVLEAKPQ